MNLEFGSSINIKSLCATTLVQSAIICGTTCAIAPIVCTTSYVQAATYLCSGIYTAVGTCASIGTDVVFTSGVAHCIYIPVTTATAFALTIAGQCFGGTPTGAVAGAVCICGGCSSASSGTATGGDVVIVGGLGSYASSAAGGTVFLCGGTIGGGNAGIGGDACITGGLGTTCGVVKLHTGGSLKLATHTLGVCVTGTLNSSGIICSTTSICANTLIHANTCGIFGTCVTSGSDVCATTSLNAPTTYTQAIVGSINAGLNIGIQNNAGTTFQLTIDGQYTNAPTGAVGGIVYMRGGCSTSTSGTATGGAMTICGGYACNTGSGAQGLGGALYLCGGYGCAPTGNNANGGHVCIVGGVGAGTCGTVCIFSGAALKLNTLATGVCITGCGYATDFVASSDCRLKTGITPISNALSMVMELQGVCYLMCDDCENEVRVGLIAQDVQKILPEVVSHDIPTEDDAKYGITDNKLGLKYDKMVAVLIEAIKEQQIQIDNLKDELNYIKFNKI